MHTIIKKATQHQPAFILRLLFITWIIMKFISYPLWTGDRAFPLAPVWEQLQAVPAYVHSLLLWGSVAGMAFCLWLPSRKILWIILAAEMLACLCDQNRWQPWEYQFIFMLAAYLMLKTENFIVSGWQIMLAGIYFFSGLSKLNPAFIHDIWSGLILRNWLGIYTQDSFVFRLGYLLPLAEMAAALLLCSRRFRKPALFALAAMHLGILAMFGPTGFNINEVIWPWNIFMLILLFLLFYHHFLLPGQGFIPKPFSWLLVACFCVLPFLRLTGYWDHYLSFSLYSGGIPQLYICTDDAATLQEMSVFMGNTRNGKIPCRYPVSAFTWGMKAMNTAPYPQKRVFRSIAQQWQKQFPAAKASFYIYRSGFKPTVEAFTDF